MYILLYGNYHLIIMMLQECQLYTEQAMSESLPFSVHPFCNLYLVQYLKYENTRYIQCITYTITVCIHTSFTCTHVNIFFSFSPSCSTVGEGSNGTSIAGVLIFGLAVIRISLYTRKGVKGQIYLVNIFITLDVVFQGLHSFLLDQRNGMYSMSFE